MHGETSESCDGKKQKGENHGARELTTPNHATPSNKQQNTYRTFVSLYLPMLHRLATQEFIAFDHFVSGRPVFVLRALKANPNVHVVIEGIGSAARVGIQDHVGIAGMEFSVLVFRPSHDLKGFNSPHAFAWRIAEAFPGDFPAGGRLLDRMP